MNARTSPHPEARTISWTTPDQRAAQYLAEGRALSAQSRSRAAKVLLRARARRRELFAEAVRDGRETGSAELRGAVMLHLKAITDTVRGELESSRDTLANGAAEALTEAAIAIFGKSPDALNDFAARCRESVLRFSAVVGLRIDPTSDVVEVDLPSGTVCFSLHDEYFAAIRERLPR
jgi:hypothetical protein